MFTLMSARISIAETIFIKIYLPGPVPAVLAVDHPLRPGSLPPHLLVVGVAHVPLLVVEVDVHLLRPPLDHVLQPATCMRPVERGNVEGVPTVRILVASVMETLFKAEVDVSGLVRGHPSELERGDGTPEGESILNYFLDRFSRKVCVRVGRVSVDRFPASLESEAGERTPKKVRI